MRESQKDFLFPFLKFLPSGGRGGKRIWGKSGRVMGPWHSKKIQIQISTRVNLSARAPHQRNRKSPKFSF
jgi:hypothetical protein